jgi:hypothetical protein
MFSLSHLLTAPALPASSPAEAKVRAVPRGSIHGPELLVVPVTERAERGFSHSSFVVGSYTVCSSWLIADSSWSEVRRQKKDPHGTQIKAEKADRAEAKIYTKQSGFFTRF